MTLSKDLVDRIHRAIKSGKYTNAEIIDIFDISKYTFYKIKKGNIKRKTKRVTKLTNAIKKYITSYVISKKNFSYIALISKIKIKYNILICKSSIYNILSQNGIKKKTIINKMFLGDPKNIHNKIKIMNETVKRIGRANIIAVDETHFDNHLTCNKGWSKKAIKLCNIKKTKRVRYTSISSTSYHKILHNKIILGSCNGEIFLQFIKELLKKIPKGKTYGILLDNARIHHYKKLKEYIKKYINIELVYNVSYSPEFNPIEKVFNETKNYFKKNNNGKNTIRLINESFNNVKKSNIGQYYERSFNDLSLLA